MGETKEVDMAPLAKRRGLLLGISTGVAFLVLGAGGIVAHPQAEFVVEDEQWHHRSDGSVALYGDVETWPDYQRYEHVSIDASTTAVYAVVETFDVRVEVMRGTPPIAEAFPLRGTDEVVFSYDFESVDASSETAYLLDEARGVRVEVYRGDDVEGWYWNRAEVLFEGTKTEAEAWVAAQPAPASPLPIGVWMGAAGIVVILAAMALFSHRMSKPLALSFIGAATGALPTSVALVIMDVTTGEGEWKLSVGTIAILVGVAGLAAGAITGAHFGRQSELPPQS